MKKTIVLLLLLIFVMSIANIAFSQAKLTIPDAEFDFGFVPQHSKISHVFWLHSTGTDSLIIDKVRPG